MDKILHQIKSCTLCESVLPLNPFPILQVSHNSKILIAGQAPGLVTHEKGTPFNDKSGERLREWLGVTPKQFYNPELFAIIPMGFCYPGKGKSGDLPPIPLCAKTWRTALMNELNNIELVIILGKYAAKWHLNSSTSITELSAQWQTLLTQKNLVLPHPSPRNNIWLKKNIWFEKEVIPELQLLVQKILNE
jgi:uracil-DNA glycosylase family 4